jgi:hypothetical protein
MHTPDLNNIPPTVVVSREMASFSGWARSQGTTAQIKDAVLPVPVGLAKMPDWPDVEIF